MKVLLINTRYYPNILGGAERSVQFLAEAMAINGYEPVVVSASPNPGVRKGYHNGVRIYYVGIQNLYNPINNRNPHIILKPFWHIIDIYNPWMENEIGKILGAECPDVVHTHNLRGFSVAAWHAAKRRNLTIIHTLHDYYLMCLHSTIYRLGKNCASQCCYCRIHTFLKKRLSRFVSAVVGCSRFILDRHLRLGYFSQAQTSEVVFGTYPAPKISSAVSLKASRPLCLGFMGSLKKTKGIEFLIQVVTKLPGREYQLWIAGKGSERHERYLKNRYMAENINFLGFVKPESFFNAIDVLIVPSLSNEPLARVIHEAYAYGVPVIVSNRGGMPEIVEEGETGFVFDPDDPDTLSSLLVKIKKNPELRVRMRKNAIKKSQAFFPERSLSKYIRISETAIRRSSFKTS